MKTLSRHQFLKKMGAVAGLSVIQNPLISAESKPGKVKSDSLTTQLYKSLNEEQHNKICFPIGDMRQSFLSNWWYISQKNRLSNTLNKEQHDLFMNIFDDFHSEEYKELVYDQVVIDSYKGGFDSSSIGFFGKPGDKNFELVFTGHHVTRRCFGNSDTNLGFGGPVFYGHFPDKFVETKDHPGNLYWYQGKIINKVYQSLDGKQQKKSLMMDSKPRSENKNYPYSFKTENHHGLSTKDMSKDQQTLFINSMRDMLAIFRKDDIDASMKLIENDFKNLHLAFYGKDKYDVGNDKVWDVWSIESPNMVWYFRGQPHIHCYLNIRNEMS
jgi:hypothetical protein